LQKKKEIAREFYQNLLQLEDR